MSYISIKNISKAFRNSVLSFSSGKNSRLIKVFNNFSLEVLEPKIIGVVGKKNSGKTTLLKLCSGLIMPDSGEIKVLGRLPNFKDTEFLHEIGSANGLKVASNISLNVEEGLLLSGYFYDMSVQETKQQIKELSKNFNFEDPVKAPINQLSSVEKVKFELISALLHKPKIVFIDNLLDNLNLIILKEVQDSLVNYFNAEKICIFITASNRGCIEKICHEIIEL